MKTYQPNNGPIKFVVVNSEYNDDHTYNKTIICTHASDTPSFR